MLPLHLRRRQAPDDLEVDAEDIGAPLEHPIGAAPKPPSDDLFAGLAWAQAAYFAVTGVWALVSLGTFMRITGPKADTWLVKTVGVLVTVIGAALAVAAGRRRPSPEIATLAAGSAAALTAIDVVYVAKGRISPVYLLDAVAEVGLLAGWWLWLKRGRGEAEPTPASGIAL